MTRQPRPPATIGVRVPVPGGQLRIRPVEAADADGLAALYDGLNIEDRHRRFFSGFRPDRTFVVDETQVAESGGYELVAELLPHGSEGHGRIVAVAGWVALPDGDGELAITVARDWRGWLGPYLLDALLEAAAARGVANLQADVLLLNRPMLSMLHARGFVTKGHPDAGVVRVVLGASEDRMPTWPAGDRRPRVLVEVPGGRWHAEDAASAAGLQVLTCSGPLAVGGRGCPQLVAGTCPLAAGADVIVVSHPPDDEVWADVRASHEAMHPGVPVIVEPGWHETAPLPSELLAPGGDDDRVVQFVRALAEHADPPE